MSNAYKHICIVPENVHKTVFATVLGTFRSQVMHTGDCNAPSTFQRLMTAIFRDCISYVSSVEYLHGPQGHVLKYLSLSTCCIFISYNYVQVDTIVAGGSFTIWTHCIVIVWESPGDSHNLLTFTLSLLL